MIDWETFKSQLQTDPGRMLKSVLLLAGCLFMIWLIVVMQSNPGMQQNVQVQESGRLDKPALAGKRSEPRDRSGAAKMQYAAGDSLNTSEMQSDTGVSSATQKKQSSAADSLGAAKEQSGGDLLFKQARPDDVPANNLSARDNGFSSVFPTVLILLVLICGVWYWMRTHRKSGSYNGAGKLFTTIASQQLPGGPKLTVLKLNGEYWVMASGGPQGTQLMHRYAPEEWNGLEEIDKQQEKRDWKNTFLKTLNTSSVFPHPSPSPSESASGSSSQQKRTG